MAMAALNGVHAMEPADGTASRPDAVDPFTWLEARTSDRAMDWVRDQNRRTLDKFSADPRYEENYKRALEVALAPDRLPGTDTIGWVYQGWIYQLWTDDANPRGVVRRIPLDKFRSSLPPWQVVLDVGALGRTQGREYILYPPSCFAARCMLPLLPVGASGSFIWSEFDLDTLSFVKDGFKIESASIPLWTDRDTLLLHVEERTQSSEAQAIREVIKQWRRGQPLGEARTLLAVDAPRQLTSVVVTSGEVTHIYIEELHGNSATKNWKVTPEGRLVPLHAPPNPAYVTFNAGQWIYQLGKSWKTQTEEWPAGALVAVDDAGDKPTVRLVMKPGARETIDALTATPDGLLVIVYANVRGRLARFRFDGQVWQRKEIALPDFGTVAFAMNGSAQASETVVKFESLLQPPTLYRIDLASARAEMLKSMSSQFAAETFVSEQFEATSKDGTHIPYFVARPRKLAYDGQAPTLMHAYGGNGAPTYPHYDGTLGRLWLERGGVYVIANIRGGGEFGPAWHYAAVKTNRERAFEDFVAVAEDLIRRKITSPRRLGATGFSNGGGLMGVMFNRHPELFRAIVTENGVMDWIRTDLQNNTAFVEGERGSPRIPSERAFLDKVSPYQNLRKRAGAPAPLIVTSTTDDNVFPAMPRKYAARLEALGMPYYFYEAREGGHAQFVTPEQQARYYALKYTYLVQQLFDRRDEGKQVE
jgi:prolyl oligopeptidase